MARKFVKALGFGAALAASLALAPTAFAKDWKTVVIGMEGAYEPWNLTDSSGKIVGFEPDLVMDLCKRAGLECKIIAQDWDGMIPGLKAGKFDVIMDGMSITDERKKEIDFSKPYAVSPGAFLAPKDSPLAKAPARARSSISTRTPPPATPRSRRVQAALKGKTLGVQVSTTHSNFASQYLKDVADVKEYKTTDERDLDLKSGRIDASLDDYPVVVATARKARRQGPRDCRAEIHRRHVRRWDGHGHPQERRGPHRQVRQGAHRGDRRRDGEEALGDSGSRSTSTPQSGSSARSCVKGARSRRAPRWAISRSSASVRAAGAWRSSRAR